MARTGDDRTREKARAFWNTDLETIEAGFLGGRKITELGIGRSNAVPPQGGILLTRTIDLDDVG